MSNDKNQHGRPTKCISHKGGEDLRRFSLLSKLATRKALKKGKNTNIIAYLRPILDATRLPFSNICT